MRVVIFIASFILISALGLSQNQFGAFMLTSKSSIHNSNNFGSSYYTPTFTVSHGGGGYWVKSFTDKRFGNRKLHGRMLSSFVNSWSLRIGASVQQHHQKWKSKFYHYENGYQLAEHKGEKRLAYAKALVYLQHSYPLVHLKKWNAYWYAGTNFSYRIIADGGIVTWVDSGTEIDGVPLANYYDLPPFEKAYYKKFIVEAAGGIGVSFKPSTYLTFNFGGHSNWSFSTVENNDVFLYGSGSESGNPGVYDRGDPRSNSRLSNIALEIGLEYAFHRGEHSRAKF
jgi:hypothetical protein